MICNLETASFRGTYRLNTLNSFDTLTKWVEVVSSGVKWCNDTLLDIKSRTKSMVETLIYYTHTRNANFFSCRGYTHTCYILLHNILK